MSDIVLLPRAARTFVRFVGLLRANGFAVAPEQTTTLAPGGAYVLLLDIKKHLEVGWGLEMTLTFEKAGSVEVEYAVGSIGASAAPPAGSDAHMHMHKQ